MAPAHRMAVRPAIERAVDGNKCPTEKVRIDAQYTVVLEYHGTVPTGYHSSYSSNENAFHKSRPFSRPVLKVSKKLARRSHATLRLAHCAMHALTRGAAAGGRDTRGSLLNLRRAQRQLGRQFSAGGSLCGNPNEAPPTQDPSTDLGRDVVVGLDRDGDGRVLSEACGRTADGHVSHRDGRGAATDPVHGIANRTQVRIRESSNPQHLC